MRVRDGLGRRLASSLRSVRLLTSRRSAPVRPRAELDTALANDEHTEFNPTKPPCPHRRAIYVPPSQRQARLEQNHRPASPKDDPVAIDSLLNNSSLRSIAGRSVARNCEIGNNGPVLHCTNLAYRNIEERPHSAASKDDTFTSFFLRDDLIAARKIHFEFERHHDDVLEEAVDLCRPCREYRLNCTGTPKSGFALRKWLRTFGHSHAASLGWPAVFHRLGSPRRPRHEHGDQESSFGCRKSQDRGHQSTDILESNLFPNMWARLPVSCTCSALILHRVPAANASAGALGGHGHGRCQARRAGGRGCFEAA